MATRSRPRVLAGCLHLVSLAVCCIAVAGSELRLQHGSVGAVDVFTPGEGGFPCIRIPSIVLVEDTLVAFAECRNWTGDGCYPSQAALARSVGVKTAPPAEADKDESIRYVCSKRSTDSGKTWSALQVIVHSLSDEPTAVYVPHTRTLALQFNSLVNGGNYQMMSKDAGKTWSSPRAITNMLGAGSGAIVGPGVGLLTDTDRLLFIGYKDRNDYVWYSDDGGVNYTLSKSVYGAGIPHVTEAQLVQLNNGSVLANMRNGKQVSCHCRAISVSNDGGKTFGPVHFDNTLVSPVCQGSILKDTRASERVAVHGYDQSMAPIYFSNPGSGTQRVNMTVRRSVDDCNTWSSLQISQAGAAYSCLTLVPDAQYIGLLWETSMEHCTGPSCRTVFSMIPTSLFR